ncbi:MAG TPA: hypothetical protein VKE41_02870 [Roseiflexaceae bacterium]|nr:hypothetical protein [Roseiflexaceae bacterium]
MYSTPLTAPTTHFESQKRAPASVLLLCCLAAVLLAASLFSAFVLPQAPGRMAEPSAVLISQWPLWSLSVSLSLPVPRQSYSLAIALLVTSAIQFATYAGAVYLAWKTPSDRHRVCVVVGAALLFFLIAVCALPNVNRDIYNYIISGRVAAVYGANPYAVPPNRFLADPIYPYASARYMSYPGDNKLPAWMLLNVVLARLGGDDPVANLMLYRVVFLLFNIANLVLIARILQTVYPRRLLAGLVLYAWNPIVIVYGQSKVDTVMAFFLLLAALALVREKRKLAVVVLGLSTLVKLITLPLVAVSLLYELRSRGAGDLAKSALLLGLTAMAFYAPFWYGPQLLTTQLTSIGDVAAGGPGLVQLMLYAGFALAVVWVGVSRDGRVESVLAGWALVLALFAFFISRLGFSWYLITLIAVASLVAERWLASVVIIFSCVSFFLNAWDSASNETVQMPVLFSASRSYFHLLFGSMIVLTLLALEVGRRARQRNRPQYGVERR